MDIFTKYDYNTWHPKVGYPRIAISEDGENETLYEGRDPREFFQEFDITKYQKCRVLILCREGVS